MAWTVALLLRFTWGGPGRRFFASGGILAGLLVLSLLLGALLDAYVGLFSLVPFGVFVALLAFGPSVIAVAVARPSLGMRAMLLSEFGSIIIAVAVGTLAIASTKGGQVLTSDYIVPVVAMSLTWIVFSTIVVTAISGGREIWSGE